MRRGKRGACEVRPVKTGEEEIDGQHKIGNLGFPSGRSQRAEHRPVE